MICKKCNHDEFIEKEKGPHIGLYCKKCDTWQKWKSKSEIKKNNDCYIREYMANEEATEKQVLYIRNIIKYKGIIGSKLHAFNIIADYKKNNE